MTLQQKIDDLEKKAKNSLGNTRKLFEQRARLLKWALEKRDIQKFKDTLL